MEKINGEVIIYTCIVGNYDTLSRPKRDHSKDGVKYICFSDDIVPPKPWERISLKEAIKSTNIKLNLEEPRRVSRFLKFNPSLFFDCPTLWVDGNARVLGDPRGVIANMDSDLGFFLHPKKRNLSREARYARRKSTDRSIVDKQLLHYIENYDESLQDAPVYAGGVIASRRSEEADDLLETIWKEYRTHSDRDQLSISKVIFLANYPVSILPGRITHNRYAAIYHGHRPTPIKTSLELGKRGRGKGEWFNLDIKGADINSLIPPLPDRVHLQKWKTIKAIHFWEHLYLWEARELAKECYKVLEPGGQLVIECPNIISAAKGLLKQSKGGNKYIWHVLYGNPNYKDPSYVHRWGYTPETLKDQLIEYGGFQSNLIQIQKAKHHVPDRDFRIVATKD